MLHDLKRIPLVVTAFLLTSVVLSSSALAAESTNTSAGLTLAGGPLAIRGYDPVAYFKSGEARRGAAQFEVLHEGAVYRFLSRENLTAFERNPEKYAPQYGGFCAYGVAVGKKFDGDPEVFEIIDGKLYFNLNPEIKATWKEDTAGNIRKADQQWPTIRNRAAGSL